ncbi:HAMP domain-containing histidine kinase [Nitrospirales bacterium NOB]|nr:sensor histidine kinase [Nitrospira sp. NTP2]MCK6493086.1 HAMP domain-containing histidine kinase [Nitrospira sp.]MDL1890399.1 HAMP domain-containing histidine kinase [Nitrospirales bacterium NOB]MEB2338554.1 HAMP domain-containing sensor histidine kinase [Nitrospirales bacterium]QOJ33698.1 MAG: HAMP domain-containing histidine kinase [Nitrospira sp.]
MRLSIFWRLVLTYLVIIGVMTAVNLYALFQIRTLAGLNTEVGSHHHPEIDAAKRLLASFYDQVQSEKKYLAVQATTFLEHFEEERRTFQAILQELRTGDATEAEARLLKEIDRIQQSHLTLFQTERARTGNPSTDTLVVSEGRRNALAAEMDAALREYIGLHEARIAVGVDESRESLLQAETVTRHLILLALLFGLGLAAVASYNILRPLRRLQGVIQEMGQGNFRASLDGRAPRELRELGDTVKSMGAKLQQLDDIKREFLAHVSHELRTPMASIQEGTHLLLDEIPGPLTEDQRTTLRIMSDSGRRLMSLISTILDLSKMEAGMMDYRFGPTDLRRVAEISINKLRLLADAKQVRLSVEAPIERYWAKADSARVEQVLDNLLSNALKFSPEGEGVLLRIEPDPDEGLLFVSVTDRGPGIPPEDLPRIFERFYQGRTTARNAAVGSGLGLALAKKVVEAHGGRIWVESVVGKGTTVRFILCLTNVGALAA